MQSNIAELLHQYFALGVAEGREGRNHDTEAGDAQRVLSEIEAEIAALSAAEPVAYLTPKTLSALKCSGFTVEMISKTPDGLNTIAVYAAPPAPSVAVQALQWIVAHPAESNAVVWDVAKNVLSAQVQDVAGWQEISTGPKDGSSVLGFWSYAYPGDKEPTTGIEIIEWYDGKFQGWKDRDGVTQDGVYTHWMPLPSGPAAPAKQEGKA